MVSMDKFKVESGVQLLSRLSTKKTKIENFYPNLFQSGPKYGEVIEIFSNRSSSFLLIDLIAEALIPKELGGPDAGVLLINTDGLITHEALTASLQKKLAMHLTLSSNVEYTKILMKILENLYILNVFDATQLYTTLQNLDSILLKQRNISLCIIDTFTAFYWSEQNFKIAKMDSYLKKLLRIVQKALKCHEITIIYTRPEYFNSGKELIENLEACCESPTVERVNFRIQLLFNEDQTCTANIKTFNSDVKRDLKIEHNVIIWL